MNVPIPYCLLSSDPRAFTETLWKSNTSIVLRRVPAQQVEKTFSGSAISTESKQRCGHSCVHTLCPPLSSRITLQGAQSPQKGKVLWKIIDHEVL